MLEGAKHCKIFLLIVERMKKAVVNTINNNYAAMEVHYGISGICVCRK
ncbi:MAG: hypothetical protein KBG92_00190 [Spirochaetes bacterium]|jgi:hypothetical protein|nr:hypothetical protein [Spirochaetota bacterium]